MSLRRELVLSPFQREKERERERRERDTDLGSAIRQEACRCCGAFIKSTSLWYTGHSIVIDITNTIPLW